MFKDLLTKQRQQLWLDPKKPAATETPAWQARAHLFLGDTATARRTLRLFADSTLRTTPLLTPLGSLQPAYAGMVWPRMFLLQADLAAVAGDRAEATQGYRRVIGLWEDGDAEVQPVVRRAREALARLAAP
jgi:hypothetical protein